MANRRFIDFPIAASVGDNDIVLIWQDGLNKQTTKSTLFAGSPSTLASLTDVDISALTNGQILQYNSTTSKWENVDRTDIDLDQLGDVTIVSPTNGQVLVYNSSTSKWENSSGGFVPYTGAVTTVNLGAQSILAGSFVKAGGTSAQFLKADGSVDSNTYLTTGSAAATYVPYTGATADVDLGTHDLTAERGTFANNGSSDTLTVNHTSGSGIGVKVTKGGNNEALLVTKTSGSGNAMAVVGGRTALVDLSLSSVSNATGNFLTISGGVVHQRTPSETRSDVGAQAQLNGTGFVKASGTTITYDNSTYQVTSEKGQPNGYASLDGNGKVPLAQINDALIGNVNYQGLWNAATNNPTLANPPSSGTKGYYYIVSTAGTFAGISFEVGDWIISNGSAWQKVDNTDAVSSVFGRTGNVIAANGDYNTSQVTENTNLYYTEARVSANTDVAANTAARHNAVTLGTANGLSLSTQQLSLQLATSGQNGALSSTDWTTFNNKENAITAGTTAQYFRGDKTFQTLNTAAVPESGNLYFTNARAIASVLTGYTSGAGTISAADSILSAIQKLNGNIGALVTGVSSVNGQTGAVTLTTTNIAEGTNLYYTEARVNANTNVAANTAARHNAVTLGTANGLSLSTQQLSLGLASAGVTGALSGTDWSTFNSKQQALNGTGFVKISGTTISYDNSTYLTTAAAASTYLPLAGGTMTGNINWAQTDRGIVWSFNTDGASIKFYNTGDGDTDSRLEFATLDNNDEYFRWGHIPSGGSFYESMRLRPIGSGSAELIVSGKIIKSGGTTSQFLKANGDVDSNSYYLASNPSAFIALTALSGTAPIQYNNTTGAISITQASGSTNGFLSSTDWNTFNNKANSVVGGYLPLSGGTMTGVITTPNGTFGIIVGDDSRLADRNIANTLFLEGNQNNDRGYINFSETTGNALGAVNGGDLTWRGNVVWHAGNITPVPTSRTITINGTTLDLSANRTYNVGTVTSVAALTLGTSGTDLSSSVANGTTTPVITLNVPTASATNRGALSAADWTTFNNKQNALTNPVTGTGTTNYLPKFTGTSTIGNSQIFDNGSAVGIGTASVTELLTVNGEISAVTRFRVNPSTQSNQIIGDGNAFSIGGSNNLGIRNDSGSIVFASGGATVQLQLNTSGNLGLGVTPSAWGSDFRVAMQLGGGGSIAGAAGVGGNSPTYIAVGGNYYLNSSAQPIYIASVAASRYEQNAGQHSWSTAPSGTAGNAISFTQAMTLGSNSGLSIGTPSAAPSQGLLVQGNVGIGASPYTKLDVAGSLSINGRPILDNSSAELYIGGITGVSGRGTDVVALYTANTERMRITSTGNLIAGFNQTTTTTIGRTFATTHASANRGATLFYGINDGSNGGMFSYNVASSVAGYNSQYITFETHEGAVSAGERMRITSGGNVGIGTTSPNSLLNVVGNGAANGLTIKSSGNVGTYPFRVTWSGGTDGSWFCVNDSGNVGIGTTSPTRLLEVLGSSPSLAVIGTSGSVPQLQLVSGGVVNWSLRTNQGAASDFTIYQDSTERIRITSTGNVGIGTNTPTAKLQVVGEYIRLVNSADSQNILLHADTSRVAVSAPNGNLAFDTANAERMRIFSDGNVFIGSSPSNAGYKLDVNGNQRWIFRNNSSEITDLLVSTESANSLSKLSFLWYGNETASLKFYRGGNSTGSSLGLWTQQEGGATTERLHIDTSGRVGIGTNGPQSNLQVLGTIKVATGNAQGILGLGEANGTTVNVGLWRGAANAPTTDGNFLNLGGFEGIVFASSNAAIGSQTERMRITSGGNVLIGTTTDNSNKLRVNGSIWADGAATLNGNFRIINSNGFNDSVNFDRTAINGLILNSSGNLILNGTTGSSRITCYGDGYFSGGIQTGNPYGSTSANWLLGRFLTETTSANGSIRVQIGSKYYNIAAEDLGEVPT